MVTMLMGIRQGCLLQMHICAACGAACSCCCSIAGIQARIQHDTDTSLSTVKCQGSMHAAVCRMLSCLLSRPLPRQTMPLLVVARLWCNDGVQHPRGHQSASHLLKAAVVWLRPCPCRSPVWRRHSLPLPAEQTPSCELCCISIPADLVAPLPRPSFSSSTPARGCRAECAPPPTALLPVNKVHAMPVLQLVLRDHAAEAGAWHNNLMPAGETPPAGGCGKAARRLRHSSGGAGPGGVEQLVPQRAQHHVGPLRQEHGAPLGRGR